MIRALLFVLTMSIARAEFAGDWILKSASNAGAAVEFPPKAVTMKLTLVDDGYQTIFQAGNSIRGGMIVDNEISDVEVGVHFTQFSSTRMMPPPQLRDIERFITKSIPLMVSVVVDDSGDLLMKGPSVDAVFSPAE